MDFNKNLELAEYIIRLVIFVNNFNKYDMVYIKEKFDFDKYYDYRQYFKKNYKKFLLFNSLKAEKLFINFINIDLNFIKNNYKFNKTNIFINFFICRKPFFFNTCLKDKNFDNTKSHISNCSCKIKVKSVVNLPLKTLMFILDEFESNKTDLSCKSNKSLKTSTTKNIIKTNSGELINCINKLEKANNNLGLDEFSNEYIVNSCIKNNKNNKNNLCSDDVLSSLDAYEFASENNLRNTFNTINNISNKKQNNMQYSDSINIDTENKDIFIKKCDNNRIKRNIESKEIMNLSKKDYSSSKSSSKSYSKSSSSSTSSKSSNKSSSKSSSSSSSSNSSNKSSSKYSSSSSTSKSSGKSSSKLNIAPDNDVKNLIDILLEYINSNNNKLLDESNDIGTLAINIKNKLKAQYPIEIANNFDKLYHDIVLVKMLSDTEDMNNYYKLYKDIIRLKNDLI